MTGSTEFIAGSPKQHKYIASLAARTGFASALAACAVILGKPEEDLRHEGVATTDARKVIEALQVQEADAAGKSDGQPRSHRSPYTTAKQLRAYATGEQTPPQDLDEHALWVLDRLHQHERARALLAGEAPPPVAQVPRAGTNGNAPIQMDHLLGFFKSWDRLAEAFRVTVPTAKAWGVLLPESRACEAEVRTNGYVRAPRDAQGHVL